MRRFLVLPMLLIGAGCHHLNRTGSSACGEMAGMAACAPDGAQVETRCPEEVRVKAPPQKIVINRQREERQPVSAPAPAQELMLVPRTVYVPYVPIAPTTPLRMAAPEPPRPPLGAAPPCLPVTESSACPSPDMSRALKEVDELNARLQRIESVLQGLCQSQGVSVAPGASSAEPTGERSSAAPAALSPRR